MRDFTDSAGTEWTVFEIRRQGNEEENWAYLPQGFRAGWLCFESKVGKRRLSPVPDGWKSLGQSDLDTMLKQATAVRARRDFTSGESTLDDATGDAGFQA